jgi:formylglycine-generating enzyme required for sulfatase activity
MRLPGAAIGQAAPIKSFLISTCETSYEQWNVVHDWAINNSYSFLKAADYNASKTIGYPVLGASWRDAVVWCNALTEYYNYINGTSLRCAYYTDSGYTSILRTCDSSAVNMSAGTQDKPYVYCSTSGNTDGEQYTGDGFHLLTNIEWDLAVRYIDDYNNDGDITDPGEYYPDDNVSGADAAFNVTSGASDIDGNGAIYYTKDVSTYSGNCSGSFSQVLARKPNALGIHDLCGNLWEYTFSSDPYSGDRPDWITIRGGCYTNDGFQPIGLPFGGASPNLSGPNAYGFRFCRSVE